MLSEERRLGLKRLGLLALATAVVAAVVAGESRAARPSVTPLERVRALVQPSIAYLDIAWEARVYDRFNKNVLRERAFRVESSCTGFFITPQGHLITAGHCVEPSTDVRDALKIDAAQWATTCDCYYRGRPSVQSVVGDYTVRGLDRTVGVAYGVASSGLPSGRALPALVQGLRGFERDTGDVALLKIEANDLPALELAPDANVEVGTQIVAVGYPASVDFVTDSTFDPSFKEGSISSKKTIEGGLLPVYEISAAVSGGMSGGPTVNLQGRVIGVNSFGITGEPQAFNFVRPTSIVADLLSDKGVRNQVGEINRTYREGLGAYFDGDRDEAVEKLDAVLASVPSHQLAQEFKSKALRLPEPEEGLPVGVVIGGITAALGAAAALAFLILRRRRPAAAPAAPAAPLPSQSWRAPSTVVQAAPTGSAPVLVVRVGGLAGRRFPIEGELLIGRENADVMLDDPEVSRRHAIVRSLDGALEITDLRSSNGTYVDGARIKAPTRVGQGAVIQIGGTSLEAEVPRSAAQSTVSRRRTATVLRSIRRNENQAFGERK